MIERIIGITIILVLGILLIRYKVKEYAENKRRRKRFKRGDILEKKAKGFLIKKGYDIIDEQYECYHNYLVDGEMQSSKLIVDYVVQRKSKVYLVEVKSGKKAISIANKDTRRQLLEYDTAIENDGAYLLDMENEKLSLIEFFSSKEEHKNRLLKLTILIAIVIMFIPYILPKIITVFIFLIFIVFPNFFEKVLK